MSVAIFAQLSIFEVSIEYDNALVNATFQLKETVTHFETSITFMDLLK